MHMKYNTDNCMQTHTIYKKISRSGVIYGSGGKIGTKKRL